MSKFFQVPIIFIFLFICSIGVSESQDSQNNIGEDLKNIGSTLFGNMLEGLNSIKPDHKKSDSNGNFSTKEQAIASIIKKLNSAKKLQEKTNQALIDIDIAQKYLYSASTRCLSMYKITRTNIESSTPLPNEIEKEIKNIQSSQKILRTPYSQIADGKIIKLIEEDKRQIDQFYQKIENLLKNSTQISYSDFQTVLNNANQMDDSISGIMEEANEANEKIKLAYENMDKAGEILLIDSTKMAAALTFEINGLKKQIENFSATDILTQEGRDLLGNTKTALTDSLSLISSFNEFSNQHKNLTNSEKKVLSFTQDLLQKVAELRSFQMKLMEKSKDIDIKTSNTNTKSTENLFASWDSLKLSNAEIIKSVSAIKTEEDESFSINSLFDSSNWKNNFSLGSIFEPSNSEGEKTEAKYDEENEYSDP